MISRRVVLRLTLPAVMLLLLAPASVQAHTELLSTDPPDGAAITVPYAARASFSEALQPERSRAEVRDAANNVVAVGAVDPEDETSLLVELPELAPGTYRARWIAVGDDGHVVRETTEFTVERAIPSAPPQPTPPASASPAVEPTGELTAPVVTTPPPPAATPVATPAPIPAEDGQPTAGTGDLLITLLVAGLIVGAVFFVLWRRRPA